MPHLGVDISMAEVPSAQLDLVMVMIDSKIADRAIKSQGRVLIYN